MIYTYEELLNKKEKSGNLEWDNISKDQLMSLFFAENISDKMIADLYAVSKSRVVYKRRKLEVTYNSKNYYTLAYNEIKKNHRDLTLKAKENLLKKENIDKIAIALTHYLFRNGPIEDMHANGQLKQTDMKILNKYMVNRIAGILKLINDEDWIKLELLLEAYKYYGSNWDKVQYDTKEIDDIYELICSNKIKI